MVASKNKVIVKILGQEYKLMSDDTREYMQGLSNYVDDRMSEIAETNKKLSTAMTAVLTALNIADDFFKLKIEHEALKKRLSHPLADVEHTKQKLEDFNEELEKRNSEYERMISQFEELMQSTSVYEEELEALKDKLNLLSYELNNKEEKLRKSSVTIKKLETELATERVAKRDNIELMDV